MKKITMADVAKELNISKATVSRALNGKEDISDALKQKVIDKCNELGYQVNYTAKALSTNKHNTIGIVSTELLNYKDEVFYKEIYTNIVLLLEEKGYTSSLKVFRKDKPINEEVPNFLKNGMVDGIIILGEIDKDCIELYSSYGKPIVLVDFDLGNIKYDSVVTNNVSSISKVTKHFINEGFTDICFVGNDEITGAIADRYWAYDMEMRKANLQGCQIKDLKDSNDEPSFVLSELSADVFICNNDYSAFRLIEFFNKNGIKVPQEKKVIGFDNTLYSSISRPQISTCDVKRGNISMTAISLLLARIEDPEKAVTNISLEATFIQKEST